MLLNLDDLHLLAKIDLHQVSHLVCASSAAQRLCVVVSVMNDWRGDLEGNMLEVVDGGNIWVAAAVAEEGNV